MNTIFLVEIYSFIEMDRWMQSEIITLKSIESGGEKFLRSKVVS